MKKATAKAPAMQREPAAKAPDFEGFESSVLEAAQEQANRILQQGEAESRAAYEAVIGQQKADPVAAHKTESKAALRRKVAGAKQNNLHKLLVYRKQLVNGLFAECEEALSDFVKSKDYPKFVADTLAPYADKAKEAGGCIVRLRIGDEAPKKALEALLPGVQFSEDPTIYIGGAKLQCGRIVYDETLGQRLREQRTAFLQRCNLHINTVGTELAE